MLAALARDRIIAGPGFNRWWIPPAALAIHLSIGQAYAFSVFKLPLTRTLGVTHSAPGDWTQTQIAWVFTLAIACLGLSAALFGRWLEEAGPRKSAVVAACCWGAGFFLSALAVRLHQLWLLYLGYGVVGGCGLGLGYITPVSTLIRWFPDRRGMATGMAIMGFGGGAMIASPLSQQLLDRFASPESTGVWQTMLVLGTVYLAAMLLGAAGFRLPPPGWQPAGWTPAPGSVVPFMPVETAVRTRAFWLLWAVLLLNVTAGIGILEQASPMIQELFPGKVDAVAASGFVGLLSLFNMGGRFFWSSVSDRIGRKVTYAVFFVLGTALYLSLPLTARLGSPPLFVAACAVILTLYGGGFATIPAYLSDLFGTQYVGAIHGRLLTAWSLAGFAGPLLVNGIREAQLRAGAAPEQVYDPSMFLMAGLLLVGLCCNLAVRPVPQSVFRIAPRPSPSEATPSPAPAPPPAHAPPAGWLPVAWLAVGLPLAWGVAMTVLKAALLF